MAKHVFVIGDEPNVVVPVNKYKAYDQTRSDFWKQLENHSIRRKLCRFYKNFFEDYSLL